jgi:hypothetical protein
MTNDEFKCWINGYLTLSTEDFISIKQLVIIKNHINLVKAIEGSLDLNIEHFLSMIEENMKKETLNHLSELKETWSKYLTLQA